ncbi:hypothetical protein BHE74_00045280 [Ensete ventricosum]|nr:hypothetical protein BHE74_00045280 [Ensete ventricosum]
MAWVLLASRLEYDVKVFVMRQPLPNLISCISLAGRGDVTARGWPSEDDVDLILDWTFGISGSFVGSRSISDQKNLDGLSPVKNVWMARDGWRSGIPWTCEVNRPTNWDWGSSLPRPSRSSQGGRESPTHQRVRRIVQDHMGIECSDVLCRIAAAIVRLEDREPEGPPSGPRRAANGLGRLVLSGNQRCRTIRYRSRGRFEPDRNSDFATELAQEWGRLRELPRLGTVAALPQAGFPDSGLQATPFAGTPLGEPIGELPNCLDLASEAEESLGYDDERSRVGRW